MKAFINLAYYPSIYHQTITDIQNIMHPAAQHACYFPTLFSKNSSFPSVCMPVPLVSMNVVLARLIWLQSFVLSALMVSFIYRYLLIFDFMPEPFLEGVLTEFVWPMLTRADIEYKIQKLLKLASIIFWLNSITNITSKLMKLLILLLGQPKFGLPFFFFAILKVKESISSTSSLNGLPYNSRVSLKCDIYYLMTSPTLLQSGTLIYN